jgi:[citrate (pro-3S)-lyase] ligase
VRASLLFPLGFAERALLRGFLARLGLDLELDVEYSSLVRDGETLVACASIAGDVIKCVGVDPEWEGEGVAAKAIELLIAEAEARGQRRLFVYTKPKNRAVFESLGFRALASVNEAMLLERGRNGFDDWADEIRSLLPGAKADGAVVVNCNPFTLGHRFLIERAAKASDRLLVLVVAGDRSSIPGATREALVRAGTKDLSKVTVASGGAYCVSGVTFPAYYLKEKSKASEIQAALDAELFAERIAPAFKIRTRFVGSEPFCAVTAAYNRALAEVLNRHGIGLVELERSGVDGRAISASAVRAAIREGRMESIKNLVPQTTFAWLNSPDAQPVLEAIRSGLSRH